MNNEHNVYLEQVDERNVRMKLYLLGFSPLSVWLSYVLAMLSI